MTDSDMNVLFEHNCFTLTQAEKELLLLPIIKHLDQLHAKHCERYATLMNAFKGAGQATKLSEMQPMVAQSFKQFTLRSVGESEIVKTLTSSGTTSQTLSRIYLDHKTAGYQSKALVRILQSYIGKKRLPMLIADSRNMVSNRQSFSARGAGIQGLSIFGRDHTWLFDEDMNLDINALQMFCKRYEGQPVLIFGFTYMIWEYLLQEMKRRRITCHLPDAVLLHSGGWKKLQDKAVNNETFKHEISNILGTERVYNFYGMVEQTGSVFMECEKGYFHASLFSEVFARDPVSMKIKAFGESGVLQVMSALPWSYPGHNILTEDEGTVFGVDDCMCGRKGAYFSVKGRFLKSESRGCSDTFVA